tara:strand:- start:257 stop:388 length:132 start_codon:yes stop_codon:yes gene_type:complete
MFEKINDKIIAANKGKILDKIIPKIELRYLDLSNLKVKKYIKV